MKKPLAAVLLILGALSFIDAAPAAVRISGGIVLAFYLPGLAFLLLLGDRWRSAIDGLYLPLLLSPAILAILLLASFRIAGSLHGAVTVSVLIPALIVIGTLFVGKNKNTAITAPVPWTILFISLAFGGLILIAYLVNGFLLVSSDAWYHISIVNEIVNRGIPPKDPWFADQRIRYMWIYHLFIAGFRERSGIQVPMAMGIFNVINAFVFPYLVARLTAVFRAERRYVLCTPLFAIAGIQSASWILWPVILVRALFGVVRDSDAVDYFIHRINLNGTEVMDFLTPSGTFIVNVVDKFCVITAFNYALNLFLLCFIVSISADFLAKRAAKACAAAFLIILGAFLFHVVIGTSLMLTVIGTSTLMIAAGLLRSWRWEKQPLRRSLTIAGAAVLAAAMGLPYLRSLSGGAQSGDSSMRHLHVGIESILTIVAPLAVLFFPSRAAFKEMLTLKKGEHKTLLGWLLCLAGLSVFVDLPTVNESKFIMLFFLLLTPPVAWQIIDGFQRSRGARRMALALGVGVLFIVPTALTVRGFILQRPSNPMEVRRAAVSGAEQEIFAWIEGNTPIDAVFMEGNDYNWMPVFGERRSFIAHKAMIETLGYRNAEVERCLLIRNTFFSAAPVSEEDIGFLRELRMGIYFVLWREDGDRIPGLEIKFSNHPEWFERVYGGAAGTVYRLVS
jgi:hypothetical protein